MGFLQQKQRASQRREKKPHCRSQSFTRRQINAWQPRLNIIQELQRHEFHMDRVKNYFQPFISSKKLTNFPLTRAVDIK